MGVGVLSFPDDGPLILPTPLENADTSQVGSGAAIDQGASSRYRPMFG